MCWFVNVGNDKRLFFCYYSFKKNYCTIFKGWHSSMSNPFRPIEIYNSYKYQNNLMYTGYRLLSVFCIIYFPGFLFHFFSLYFSSVLCASDRGEWHHTGISLWIRRGMHLVYLCSDMDKAKVQCTKLISEFWLWLVRGKVYCRPFYKCLVGYVLLLSVFKCLNAVCHKQASADYDSWVSSLESRWRPIMSVSTEFKQNRQNSHS